MINKTWDILRPPATLYTFTRLKSVSCVVWPVSTFFQPLGLNKEDSVQCTQFKKINIYISSLCLNLQLWSVKSVKVRVEANSWPTYKPPNVSMTYFH